MKINVGDAIVVGGAGPTPFPSRFIALAMQHLKPNPAWVGNDYKFYKRMETAASKRAHALRSRKTRLSAGQIRKRNKKIARAK